MVYRLRGEKHALVSQLVFGDAHELSGRGGGLEAGDGGELVVVDLGSVWVLACCSSGEDVVKGWNGR